MRSCSAVMSRTSASRCSCGRPGLRASVSSWARSAVSGVRSSCPASPAKRRVASSARSVAALDALRRASISFSAPASERTSSGPASSASGVERSSAPLMRAAPERRRASGRTASVVKPHAASAVRREREGAEQEHEPADAPDALVDRRERAEDLQPRVAGLRDRERQRAPRLAGDVDGLEAVVLGDVRRRRRGRRRRATT